MKTTIGIKIGFAFFVLLILFGVVGTNIYYNVNDGISALDQIKEEAQKQSKIGNLRFNSSQLLMASNDYIITNKEHYKNEYKKINILLEQYYHDFINSNLTDKEKQIAYDIKTDIDSIRSYSERIFLIANPRQSSQAAELMEKMDYTFGASVNARTTEIFDGVAQRIQENRKHANVIQAKITTIVYRAIIIAFIFSLIIIYLSIYKITKPLKEITMVADCIARGDYSNRLVIKTRDEISSLAKSFNVMSEAIELNQKALLDSKQLTEAIVSTVPVGLLVFDQKGEILYVNDGFANAFGLDPGMLLNQPIEPMFEKLQVSEECRNYVLTREPVHDVECNYSDPQKGLRIMNLTLSPIKLTDGESLLIIEDITKRKQDEQIIRENEKHFRSLIENSADGLCVICPDGHLLYESPSNKSITGYEHNELINQNILTLFHSDDLIAINDLLMSLLEQPLTTISSELRFQHKDGRWLWIEAKWKNALNEPAIGGIVINCHDITERKHSEETLKLISATVEQTADCVVITDKNGIIQYVNEAFVKETGYSREEAIGNTPRILSSGQHSPKFFESLWKTILSGEVFSATFINKRKDGELIYEDKTITPIKDKEGNITHFVSTAKNISEQLRAEETLRKKDERHKVVIENIFKFIPEGVLVLTESLNLLKQNKAFDDIVQKYAALLGYTEQELAEMIIRQLRTKIVTGNSNQPEADEPLTQEIHIGKNDQLEPDPSGRDKLILQFNTARMFLAEEEEEEEEATIVISLSDVTERKTAEDLLHKSEAKFRKLISSLPDAVLVVNTEGRITLFNNNATKIFGYTQDEMLNCTIEDLIPKHNREHHLEERNKYLSKPASRAMGEGRELFALRKDGSEFPTEIMLEPVEINNKLVIITIVRDVTTRKKMLEDLIAAKDTAEAANSLKDAFIANISHEIRTPLNGILGLTSLIKDIYSQYIQEEDKELFSGIEDSSKRIIRTVDMILNYSRLQVGEFPISPEVLNLSSICGSLINEFKAAAESASIALAFENKSENANIFADDYSITQIISNLIDNAIKYTKKGYVKVILYNESNDELLLDIKDSGIGIADDYLNEIFVPYIQEEMGYGRAYEGVGLGLPLVNQFIELNNIKISVVSKKGVGTTFTINFGKGVNALEETETKDVKTADQRQEAQKNIQVLLVEDDAANQITVQRFLGSRYSVLTADSSDAAINILEKNNIDVILMDISIKGKKNGLELTKELKESKEYSHIPIIAVTAHAFEKDKQNAFDAGCDEYLSKPFTKELLLDTIAKIV